MCKQNGRPWYYLKLQGEGFVFILTCLSFKLIVEASALHKYSYFDWNLIFLSPSENGDLQNWLNQTKPPIPLFGAEKVGINAYIVVGTDAKCTQKNTYADKELKHARERGGGLQKDDDDSGFGERERERSLLPCPRVHKRVLSCGASAKTHPSIPNLVENRLAGVTADRHRRDDAAPLQADA